MNAKINVTLPEAVLRELDALVEVSASGTRSAMVAGLVHSSWFATFPEQATEVTVAQPPGPVQAGKLARPHPTDDLSR